MYDNPEEDLGYVEPIEIVTVILLEFPQDNKFGITSVTIQLVNLMGVFDGLPTDDVNMHIMNFMGICTSYNMLEVSQKYN